MKRLVIRNQEQLAAALNRAEELAGCAEGSDEALECLVIADAVHSSEIPFEDLPPIVVLGLHHPVAG